MLIRQYNILIIQSYCDSYIAPHTALITYHIPSSQLVGLVLHWMELCSHFKLFSIQSGYSKWQLVNMYNHVIRWLVGLALSLM